jgi:CHAD domain-containing protein
MQRMEKTEGAAATLTAYLDDLVDELRRMIPDALDQFESEAVHKSRVATRRLKAALDLLEPVLDKKHAKPFAELGKKLRRRLGPLRDGDVMLEHLETLRADESLAPATKWLHERVAADRDAARRDSQDKAIPARVLSKLGTWWGVREDVIAAEQAVPSLLAESLHLQLDRFIENADPQQRHDPHQLRIAGKLLRYTLEIADAVGVQLPKGLTKTFKAMQERLGDWHDQVVLAEQAMRCCLDEELALHDPRTLRGVLKLIDHATANAERQLNDFDQLWAEQGDAIAQSIRETFPLTRSVIEWKTDRDPAGSTSPPVPEGPSPDAPPAA